MLLSLVKMLLNCLGHSNIKDALGHELPGIGWDAADSLKEGNVIGVVKDIQLNSMRETMNPVILHVYPSPIVRYHEN